MNLPIVLRVKNGTTNRIGIFFFILYIAQVVFGQWTLGNKVLDQSTIEFIHSSCAWGTVTVFLIFSLVVSHKYQEAINMVIFGVIRISVDSSGLLHIFYNLFLSIFDGVMHMGNQFELDPNEFSSWIEWKNTNFAWIVRVNGKNIHDAIKRFGKTWKTICYILCNTHLILYFVGMVFVVWMHWIEQ